MRRILYRFLRWLLRADHPHDTIVEEYVRKNREALERKRQSAVEQAA
jgi:hypothetical protein